MPMNDAARIVVDGNCATTADCARAPLAALFVRHNRYRYHHLFSVDEQAGIVHAQIDAAGKATGAIVLRAHSGDSLSGAAILTPLPWDSGHFGIPMARLDAAFAPGAPAEVLAGTISRVCREARERGITHVSTHVDADDYAQLDALFAGGFRFVDAKRTYIARRSAWLAANTRLAARARPWREEDRDASLALARAATFASRFTRDPDLPQDRATALYERWMQRLLDAPTAERSVSVVERGGRVVACGGVRAIAPPGTPAAKHFFGDGLFACEQPGAGHYAAVIAALFADGTARASLVETAVSVNNLPAVRVLERLGLSSTVTQYALHCTLR